jgi:tetratricopeptide (TPR) repeat protein
MSKVLMIRTIFFFTHLFFCIYTLEAQQSEKLWLDSMLIALPEMKEDSSKVKALLDIAWRRGDKAGINTLDTDSAIYYARQGLILSGIIKYKWGIGWANYILGRFWGYKSDYSEALKYHLAALNTSFETGNIILRFSAYYHIGNCNQSLGHHTEALKNHLAALHVMKAANAEDMFVTTYQKIGEDYFNTGILNESLKNYREAYHWAEKRRSVFEKASSLNHIGDIYIITGKKEEGLNNFFTALKIYQDMVISEEEKKQYVYKITSAYLYYETGKTFCRIAAATSDSVKHYNKAITYVKKALPVFLQAGFKEDISKAYFLLIRACKGINDYKNALYYSDLNAQLSNSLYSKSTYLKLANVKIQYETEKAAAEYERNLVAEKAKQEKLRAEKQQMNNFLLMGLILVVLTSVFLMLFYRQSQQKKRAIERAEAIHKMAELEMQSLRSQLNPHFMFNSLNSIQTLILKEDIYKSHSYLSSFARLLRMLLENADKPFISLQKEIDFLRLYLSLENLRVPDLQYSISTDPDLNTEQTLIPNMILQPYVENAIWHGLAYKENDRQLRIRINRDNGTIKYEIEDNGVGRQKAEELKSLFRKQHQSKGMELLNKRFHLLSKEYKSEIETQVKDVMKNNEVSGTLVTIKVPMQLSLPQQN